MDFMNRGYNQLVDLLRSQTPAMRITTVLLLGLVVVSLGYLVTSGVTEGDTYLLGGVSFSSEEISQMAEAFGAAGLGGYEIEGVRVRIPRGQKAAYMAALADGNALPKGFGEHLLEASQNPSVFENSKQHQERMRVALLKDLSNILCEMNGIENAAVFYDEQLKGGLSKERVGTASVTIKPTGTRVLDAEQVRMIRQMVAGSFSGLRPERVTVSDLNARRAWNGSADDSAVGGNDDYIARKRQFESDWERKINNTLSHVPGAIVSVNVDLNPETRHVENSVSYDPKAPTLDRRSETTNSTSETPTPQGRPGLEAQSPNTSASLANSSKPSVSTEKTESVEEHLAPAGDEIHSEMAGLTPRRVSVAVSVPRRYFEEIWHKRNPIPEGTQPKPPAPNELATIELQEIKTIRTSVAALLLEAPGANVDPLSQVTVSVFEDIEGPAIEAEGVASQATDWLFNNWTTLGMFGLAALALVMLRSMVKAGLAKTPKLELESSILEKLQPASGKTETHATPQAAKRRRWAENEGSIRDELSEMVKLDPAAAATILKAWIGSPK